MRLIDADALKNLPFHRLIHTDFGETAVSFEEIDNAPTIIWCNQTSEGLPLFDLREKPQDEIVKCQDCKYRVKEWREDKRMKEKGYWAYGCKHFGEIMGYWGFGGSDDEFCSDAERTDMRGKSNEQL